MNFLLKTSLKCVKHKEVVKQFNRTYMQLNVQLTIERLLEKHAQNQDLPSLREEVLEVDPKFITPNNVDYTILSLCNKDNRRNLAIDYVKYLETKGEKLNIASISKLLKIYGNTLQNSKSLQGNSTSNDCNKTIEEEIIKIYQNLKTKYKVFDATLTESLIHALSATSVWKDSLKIFENLQKTTTPTSASYDALCITLFNHGEEEIAWNLMQEMVDKEKKPSINCYQSYISLLSTLDDYSIFLPKIEKLFEFWSTNDILIQEGITFILKQSFSRFQKHPEISTISLRGLCAKCKLKLPEAALTNEDFAQLKDAFFEKVIVGKDVFRKTTPQELAMFKRFIEEKQHYDVIIDGLNVAYSAGVKKPVHITSGHVTSVVRFYAKEGKSVLVLGRNHMKKWPHFNEMRQFARLFLTQNLSQDDPYLLFCALNSGKGTIIVSRDKMRGHLHLLKDPYLKQLFKRWLSITQHKLVHVRGDGTVIINAPSTFIQSAQKHNNVWHIPILYDTNQKSVNNIKNDEPAWMCIKL